MNYPNLLSGPSFLDRIDFSPNIQPPRANLIWLAIVSTVDDNNVTGS